MRQKGGINIVRKRNKQTNMSQILVLMLRYTYNAFISIVPSCSFPEYSWKMHMYGENVLNHLMIRNALQPLSIVR